MVTVQPYKCLKALAMTWGLQYSILKRLRTPLQQEGHLGKRKAKIDNGSRQVRAREDQNGSDLATELQAMESQASSQDNNDD